MSELIDYEGALERLGGDAEFLAELLEEMVGQIGERLTDLEQAVQNQNFDLLHRTAHGLKGAAANLNLTHLFEQCLQLEKQGQTQELSGADVILADIRNTKDALSEYVQNL